MSLIAGFVLLVGVTFTIQALQHGEVASATGVPPVQIWIDALGAHRRRAAPDDRHRRPGLLRHGLGDGELADDLRVLARRRRARAHRSGTGSTRGPGRPPTRSGSPSCSPSCCGLPYIWSSVAYGAVTSIATIGLYIAYVIPTMLRRRAGTASSAARGTSASGAPSSAGSPITWVGIITILFLLPEAGPDHLEDLQLHARRGRRSSFSTPAIYWLISRPQVVHRPAGPGPDPLNWPRSSEWQLTGDLRRVDVSDTERPDRGALGLHVPRADCELLVADGRVDTVVLAFTDMQGHSRGKRDDGASSSSTRSSSTAEGLQLPARGRRRDEPRRRVRDVVVGARVRRTSSSSPTSPRCGLMPWTRATALRPRRPGMGGRQAGGRLAARRSSRHRGPARRAGWYRPRRHRAGVHRLRGDLRAGPVDGGTGDLTPANQYNVDYSVLGTSRVEPLLGRDPARDDRRGHARRVVEGGVQPRPARDRLPLCDTVETGDKHSMFKTGAKEIASQEG